MVLETARRAILLLLTLYPENSPAMRLIGAEYNRVAKIAADAAEVYQVPVQVLIAVGFFETWCGTHPDEGGNWGAPRPGGPRNIAGTARDAARVLARGFEPGVCGDWPGSVARFRSGDCEGNRVGDAYSVRVMRLARRLGFVPHE